VIETDVDSRRMRATDLHVGNRIVQADGTVLTVTHFEVSGTWVHYRTDAGDFVSLPWEAARKTILEVIV
jgi:hypothetical protein